MVTIADMAASYLQVLESQISMLENQINQMKESFSADLSNAENNLETLKVQHEEYTEAYNNEKSSCCDEGGSCSSEEGGDPVSTEPLN